MRSAARWLSRPNSLVHTLFNSMKLFRNWPVLLIFNRHVIRRYAMYRLRNGITYSSVGFSDWGPLLGVWIDEIYNPEGHEIRSDDVVIDIGAHSGAFSLYASRKATGGMVYAFEPHPRNFEVLVRNIRENAIQNVQPFEIAVSDRSGSIKLFLSGNDLAHSILHEQDDGPEGEFCTVETLTLQEIVDRHGITRIGFLKLNCEGAEYAIIQSMSQPLLSMTERVAVQYHDSGSRDGIRSMREHLEMNGFRVVIPSSGLYHILYASRVEQGQKSKN